jgi:anthranilate/para-aminobenzoate synthase component I
MLSDAAEEYDEMLLKAQPLLNAAAAVATPPLTPPVSGR